VHQESHQIRGRSETRKYARLSHGLGRPQSKLYARHDEQRLYCNARAARQSSARGTPQTVAAAAPRFRIGRGGRRGFGSGSAAASGRLAQQGERSAHRRCAPLLSASQPSSSNPRFAALTQDCTLGRHATRRTYPPPPLPSSQNPKARPIQPGSPYPAKELCSRCGLCDTYYVAHVKSACAFLGDGALAGFFLGAFWWWGQPDGLSLVGAWCSCCCCR